MNDQHTKILGLIGLLLLCGSSLQAQNQAEEQHSFYFRGEPLGTVLEIVAQQTGTDLVFDPDLVRDISVYQRIEGKPVMKVLATLLSDTSLDYLTLSSGTIVIVKKMREKPAYGSYYGKVVDSQNGDPLPGASVMLADASGGTSTSPSGNFTITKLISGTYTVIFSYVGYEPVYKTIRIEPNQQVRETVSLDPKRVNFVPIVITGHLSQMPYYGENGQSIAPRNDLELNGRLQDVIRSLTLFPGVQYGLPMTDLHLQGGQLGEHRILLDGVPVYNPYSFGKLFSAFSPFAIDRMELHKAGYGVSQGSQISGLINMKHDIDSDGDNSAIMELDPLSLNARADLHLPDEEGNSALDVTTAARTNFWNIYREPSLRKTLQDWDALDPLVTNLLLNSDEDAALYEPRIHSSDVNFYDIHLASRYKINAYRTLQSSLYIGKNFVSTDLLREAPAPEDLPRYLYALDEYQWNNFMGQVSYDHLVSSRLDIRSQISYSTNRFHHRYLLGTNDNTRISLGMGSLFTANAAYERFNDRQIQSQVPTQQNTNRIHHGILKTSGTYSLNPHLNLDAGLQLDFVQSQVNLSDLFYLPTESHQKSVFYSGYVDSNWQLGSYWRLSAGSRFTFANFTSKLYAEPRASIQYDHPGRENGGIGYWSAQLSGGLYRQFINQYDITNPGPTSLVPSLAVWSHAGSSDLPKAWHLSGSFKLAPSTNTEVNLEWFYKWQPTAYTVSYENLANGTAINRSDFQAFAETTQIKSLGTGIRVHHSADNDKLKLIIGYDYSYNRINLSNQFGHYVPTPWNEPHRLQARVLWKFLPRFSTVVKWQTILGRTWGFRQSYYNFLFYRDGSDFGEYDFMSPENDRLDPFHQLDLSIIYKPTFNNVDMEVRLDLVNLLDRPNTIDWSLQPQNPGNTTDPQYSKRKRKMPGFSPSLTVQVGI